MTKQYNIIAEIPYEGRDYYLRDNGEVYLVAGGVHLPNHPMVSFKRFNDETYYHKADEVPGALEEKVMEILDEETK